MNILHIAEDFSSNSGGLRTVINDLSKRLNSLQHVNSYILSSRQEKGDDIELVENSQSRPWLYSSLWHKKLKYLTHVKKIDVIHIHGVWMYPQFASARYALKNNIPFIISTHGMYEPWLWKKGYLKKTIYFKFLVKCYFKRANAIHAITKDEEKNLQKLFGEKMNTQLIPNLIATKNIPYIEKVGKSEKYILYLGRIHLKKGVKILIESFIKINPEGYKLKIAGPDNDYSEELKTYTMQFDSGEKIEFLGVVKGDKKYKLYKEAHVFVAPSYSEVIGMVNLEAAIMSTPVITTFQTGLLKDWGNNGGILINPNISELKKALDKAISWTQEERKSRGEMLRELVLNNYSWERNLNRWVELYKNLLRN